MDLTSASQGFKRNLTNLFLLDQRTQEQRTAMAPSQLYVINEAIFARAFRALENFVESAFLNYAQGFPTLNGAVVKSYLNPKDYEHAYEMIKSSQQFLDWNSASKVINRSETYLDGGGPIKSVYAAKSSVLGDLKKVRNHISHNSVVSESDYRKIVIQYLLTMPLVVPSPGEFLQYAKRNGGGITILRYFLDEIYDIGSALA